MVLKMLSPDFNISTVNMWHMQNKGPAVRRHDITQCAEDCSLLRAKKKRSATEHTSQRKA